MKPNINIITLAVSNLDRTLLFYQQVLGFDGEYTRGEDHLALNLREDLSLAFMLRDSLNSFANQSDTKDTSSLICISHTAETKSEVDEILQMAGIAGGTITQEATEYEWGYSGYFKDLDGHLWEIVFFFE